jgi:hypothetical protein
MSKETKPCPGTLVAPAIIWRNGPKAGQSQIVINNIPHTGTIVHRCNKEDHPKDYYCMCECGTGWLKNFGGSPVTNKEV